MLCLLNAEDAKVDKVKWIILLYIIYDIEESIKSVQEETVLKLATSQATVAYNEDVIAYSDREESE